MKARADRFWMADGRVMNKPRLRRVFGRWGVDEAPPVVKWRNWAAQQWADRRNTAKPNRCPVPQDDVCDYGRGITLEDNPGRNPHGPFN